jgi:hypothetical protein
MKAAVKTTYPQTYDQKLMLEFQKELQHKLKGFSKGKNF